MDWAWLPLPVRVYLMQSSGPVQSLGEQRAQVPTDHPRLGRPGPITLLGTFPPSPQALPPEIGTSSCLSHFLAFLCEKFYLF